MTHIVIYMCAAIFRIYINLEYNCNYDIKYVHICYIQTHHIAQFFSIFFKQLSSSYTHWRIEGKGQGGLAPPPPPPKIG